MLTGKHIGPTIWQSVYGVGESSDIEFSFDDLTFVAGMAKRAGNGAFAATPIVQGKWDGTGTPDQIRCGRGTAIMDYFYPNIDLYQGTISLWITPEWDGDDGQIHYLFNNSWEGVHFHKDSTDALLGRVGQQQISGPSTAAWTAGTTYHVVFRWDRNKTLDGTNYACFSVNGSHTFAGSTQPANTDGIGTIYIGQDLNTSAADSIIEGLRIDRRVWYEATSGTGEPYYFNASGYIDEIAAAYAAGAGADPALVEASWDGCMCLPTDSAVGALTTGTGEAWSHPHSSALLNNTWLEDGFGPNQQDVVTGNGTNTSINFGSGATLDDVPAAAQMTIELYAKIAPDTTAWSPIMTKGDSATTGWFWRLVSTTGAVNFLVFTDGAACDIQTKPGYDARDGKWHHYAITYNDAAGRIAQFWLDGKLQDVWETAATGTYASEIASDMVAFASGVLKGDIGWIRYSDNLRYTANFKAPRTMPGADGNTVEQWAMNEGTGATAAATVTSPANDGTIANGTWTEKWEYTGTPLELTSLEFDGNETEVDCGSGTSLDDLPLADFTLEGWARRDGAIQTYPRLMDKFSGSGGWIIAFNNTAWDWYFFADFAGANALIRADIAGTLPVAGEWFHWAVVWDAAAKIAEVYTNGVRADSSGVAGTAAYQTDAAINLGLASVIGGNNTLLGATGWQRISDNKRYSANFLPPTRVNPPADDGSTISLWYFDEGAGTTVADQNANSNDGTITMGSGQWRNTFAQEYDSPGSRTYAWGASVGSDGADDGIEQHLTVVAGDDQVLRIPVRYEGCVPQARILVYDESNTANISEFTGPPLTGVHTSSGAGDDANLRVPGDFFPASLIGGTLYNITDSSSTTITGVAGTNQDELVGTLSGGTDNDWDTSDVFMLVPPVNWVWCEPFVVEAPAGCTEISYQLLNAAGDGVLHWQQAEVQTSLISNGSLETGADNPWIPTDWTNNGLGAGDSVAEAAFIHSGAGSMELAVGASNEGMFQLAGVAVGKFWSLGGWHYGDDNAYDIFTAGSTGQSVVQFDPTRTFLSTMLLSTWAHYAGVLRSVGATNVLYTAATGAAGLRYIDDLYAFQLDDVSLTVTPASQENSIESTGLRVDGRDTLDQDEYKGTPIDEILTPTSGSIKFSWTPRHNAANLYSFIENNTAYIVEIRKNDTNRFILLGQTNNVQLWTDIAGAGAITADWNCTGAIIAGTTYLMEIRYTSAKIDLLVDGVVEATVVRAVDFGANTPNIVHYGSHNAGINQVDAVFS